MYKIDEWYDKDNNKIKEKTRVKIIYKAASDKGKIPIFYLSEVEATSSESVINKILIRLSEERKEELLAKIEDGVLDILGIYPEFDSNEDEITDVLNNMARDWTNDVANYFNDRREKLIPFIILDEDELSRAIVTFDYINQGGTPLSVFDLIVAKTAIIDKSENFQDKIINMLRTNIVLPDSITNVLKNSTKINKEWDPKRMNLFSEKNSELTSTFKNQFINLLGIISLSEYGKVDSIKLEFMKKDRLIQLSPKDIYNNMPTVVNGLIRALAFLQYRCGIAKFDNLNYKLMILPIAYILCYDKNWNSIESLNKIESWYWASLFSGEYNDAQNKTCIDDIKNLYKFINNNEDTFEERRNNVFNKIGYSDDKTFIDKEDGNSASDAMKNAILQYVLSNQPIDLINSIELNAWDVACKKVVKFEDGTEKGLEIEVHHIIPLASANNINESTKKIRADKKCILNSPINYTYITKDSNVKIGGKSIPDYTNSLVKDTFVTQFIPSDKKNNDLIGLQYKENKDKNKIYEFLDSRLDLIKRELKNELSRLI